VEDALPRLIKWGLVKVSVLQVTSHWVINSIPVSQW
jgi:hypothetical protein